MPFAGAWLLAHARALPPCLQVPVLFAGSIRMNLDPLATKSDSELWAALRRWVVHCDV
jgi:ABC-type multidrug transport system fused ATPase/permease subunit